MLVPQRVPLPETNIPIAPQKSNQLESRFLFGLFSGGKISAKELEGVDLSAQNDLGGRVKSLGPENN